MLASIWIDAAALLGATYLLGPFLVKSSLRFAARCSPVEAPLDELPQKVRGLFGTHTPRLQNLGFELIGYYDCGVLVSETRSYIAYFCNRKTNDFALLAAMVTPKGTASYCEFSARFSNGLVLETNTNRVLPLTPANPEFKVFRFPSIKDVGTLYGMHRQLLEKYARGMWAEGEPRGEEIRRFSSVIEKYGPRHARIGYMYPAEDSDSYRLTWKGALFMTWRGLWPTSILRRMLEYQAMQAELLSLKESGVAATLRKA